jgi:hypothetical protein
VIGSGNHITNVPNFKGQRSNSASSPIWANRRLQFEELGFVDKG